MALLAAATPGAAGQEWPAPVGRVNDFAEVLEAPQRVELEALLAHLERETSAEVAVVTVNDLAGRSVEDYAARLFGEWGIGKKGTDNGVLILVGVRDRAMRIEVGYGLEGVLPDGLAGAIIRESFLPRFRTDDYGGGIVDGTRRVADIMRRNETLSADQRAALAAADDPPQSIWPIVVMLGLFICAGAFSLGTGIGSRVVSSVISGLVITGLSLWFALLGLPPAGLAILVVLAVAVIVVSVFVGRRPSFRTRARGPKGRGGSGWVMGGGSSGGSSGGSGSSGFGGGRSGGGGASGRW